MCSGGINHIEELTEGINSDLSKKEAVAAGLPDNPENRIQAARERFLARKGKK